MKKNYKFEISSLQHQVHELNKQKLNLAQKFTELITDDIFVSSLQDLLNNKKLLIEKANEMIRRNRNEYIKEAANWLAPIINARKENLNKYSNVGELLDNEFIGLLYTRKYSEGFEDLTRKWLDKQLDLVFDELFSNANVPKSVQKFFDVFIKDKDDPLFEGINSSKELEPVE